MKQLLLPLFLLAPFSLIAQSADSAAVASQVDSMALAANTLRGQRAFDEALATLDAAKKLAIGKFGKEHPVYATCIYEEGRVYYSSTKYAEAEPLLLEAKAIRKNTLGTGHPEYASVLNALAIMYVRMARFDEAEQLHLQVKDIRAKTLGKDHPEYINTLNNMGSLYYRSGRFEAAEELYLQVKDWRAENLGKDHIDYYRIMNNLANMYTEMGRYEEAGRFYLEIKDIQEKGIGKENADYAFTLSWLADLYQKLGRYEEAEQYILEAKATYEKTLGKEEPDYAICLEGLATLYHSLGLYETAEPLYMETRAIREKLLGSDHPDYAKTLNNLAILYEDMNRREAAEPLYAQAKSIFEKQGKETVEYAWALNNLAILYKYTGRFELAETMLKEAKTIREKTLGKEHPDFANTLEDLAILYQKTGKPEAALALHLEAKTIFEKAYGKAHPRYEECIRNLAVLYQKQGKTELARPLILESNELQRSFLVQSTRYLSERELAARAATFASDLDGLYSFARQFIPSGQPSAKGQLPALLFDNTIFYKGFLLTASNQVRRLAEQDTSATRDYERLTACHRRLAQEYVKPLSEREGVAALEQQANELEKGLVRKVAGIGQGLRQVGWQEVRDKLLPGDAAIEFVHYRYRTPEATDTVFYSALVLLHGDTTPHFVQLCEEKSLDFLFSLHADRRSDFVSDLYSYQERGFIPGNKARKSLYEMLWQPIESRLNGVGKIYFAPSGLLHRLNLGAIPLDEETKLSHRFQLVQLSSTRQLAVPYEMEPANRQAPEGSGQVILVGGIQYDLDSTAIRERNISAGLIAGSGAEQEKLNLTRVLTAPGISPWKYLKWTAKEVDSIQAIVSSAGLSPGVYTGYAATEEAFKSLGRGKPSPRSILLATHGYFFPDPVSSPQSTVGSRQQEPIFKMSDHPMIRSGLILAGANHAWSRVLGSKPFLPGMEDGILTAYEISQMNLSNTELVVLSACETGLGDIRGNEGVYGLQRAFKIAGVKYIIMSLWQVPDEETSELMTNFYRYWLKNKMTIPDAFRQAQQELSRVKYIKPHQWAGFVLVE